MRNLWTIACATTTQLRRDRLVWTGVFVAMLLALFGLALAPLSLHQESRIVLDLGLAVASVVGTLVAVCATVQLVGRELHEQRAHTWLARRLHRHTYLGGRSLGLWLAMAWVIAGIGSTTALLSIGVGGTIPQAFWPALVLTGIETYVVVSVTLVFVTWTTPVLAATFAASTIVAGHMSAELLTLAPAGHLGTWWHAAYWLLPDMQRLSLRDHVANQLPVDAATFFLQAGYGLTYAATASIIAMLILTRRRCI